MKHATLVALGALALLLLLAGCGGASGGKENTGRSVTISARSTSRFGDILTGPNGHTLYVFGADRGDRPTCYGSCAKAWPPLITRGAPSAGSGIPASKLGTTRRHDGSLQVTYAGHPLYYYSADRAPGDVRGVGSRSFGGRWYMVSQTGLRVGG